MIALIRNWLSLSATMSMLCKFFIIYKVLQGNQMVGEKEENGINLFH